MPAAWRGLVVDGTAGLTGEDLDRVSQTARQMRELADHLEVSALGALDRDGHADSLGYTTASWFASNAKVSHATARHQLATARLLETELAPAAQAWFEGRITRDHLQVLLAAANPRIRDQIADRLGDLIDGIANKRFDVWKDEVKALARELDQDGLEPDDPTLTSVSWSRSDVFAMLRGQFNAADAEVVEQIIEAHTDKLFRAQAKALKEHPTMIKLARSQLRGRAIVELLIQSQAVEGGTPAKTAVHLVIHAYLNGDTPDGTDPNGSDPDDRDPDDRDPDDRDPDPRTDSDDRNLDDGTDANDAEVTSEDPEPEGTNPFDWPDDDALSNATWRITNPDGRRLDPKGFEALLGDVEIHPLLVDHDDNPLKLGTTIHLGPNAAGRTIESLLADPALRTRLLDAAGNPLYRGRSRRYAPDDLRRVVLIRDGGCIFPGCDCTVGWADVHHIIFWDNGGLTDIIVLVALCRRHHGVAHRTGWTLRPSGDGWFIWTTPTGLRMWSQRHGIQRAGPLPPENVGTAAV